LAQRSSRKRRKQRKRTRAEGQAGKAAAPGMQAAYAGSRRKNEEARAALEPLRAGERPGAVTVGAVAAALLALANLVALIARYDPDAPRKTLVSLLGVVIMTAVAAGMWRVRYWAVLGMQTVLALAIVGGCIALLGADNALAVLLVAAIVLPSGVLFWFLVKAMARIQMPERPGTATPRGGRRRAD
jgi:hypothetical protein